MSKARGRSWSAGAAGLACCLALIGFVPANADAVPLEQLSSFGPDGTPSSSFEQVGSIAVDQADGSVYVLDSSAGELHRFGPKGAPLAFAGTSPYIEGNRIKGLDPFDLVEDHISAASQVAVDPSTHDFFVTEHQTVRAFLPDGEPREFTAGPDAGTSELTGFSEVYGVAVDSSGAIYVSDHSGTVSVFSSTGEPLTSFSVTSPSTVAVDAAGVVYVLTQGGQIKTFDPSTFPVNATTDYTEGASIEGKASSNFINGFNIDPIDSTIYLIENVLGPDGFHAWIRITDRSGSTEETIGEPGTPREDESLGGQSEGVAVFGDALEVEPEEKVKFYSGDTERNADKGIEVSTVAVFGTKIVVGPPSFSALRASKITADSALLRAFVRPNTKPTTYRFEYGTEDCSVSVCASVPLGGAAVGDGSEPVPVSQPITGLEPATSYHYRIVASNELGESEEGGAFTTQPLGGGSELSDGRVWEMVSSPSKHGGVLVGSYRGLMQAAESGDGLFYLSRGATELDPEGNRSLEVSSILSRRGPSGWSSKDITPPNSRTVPLVEGSRGEFLLLKPDLSAAVVEPHDGAHLSPLASERTPYLRTSEEPPVFTPLVTGREGVANVPPGTVFGGNPLFGVGSVRVVGANAQLSDVVLVSEVPLAAGAPASGQSMYHWRAGGLEPLSVLPASEGGGIVAAAQLGSDLGSRQHAISEDGERIFWQPGNYGGGSATALYLRDTAADETVRLDVPRPDASGSGKAIPEFMGANRDGAVVLFKDTQQLTADASPAGSDLYRCEIAEDSVAGGCSQLTNITAQTQSEGESAEVVKLVAGVSDDANTAYFVARGVLDAAANGYGDVAAPGAPNLYGWREGEGVRFIATLSENDSQNWGGKSDGFIYLRSTTISPSGRYLAFMSRLSLTEQGNRDAETGEEAEEAFLYDAEADGLRCLSCDPSGAAPTSEVSEGDGQSVDPRNQWQGRRVAAILPEPSLLRAGEGSMYQSRALLDNGRAFFHALGGLVPGDSNHQWDVYQYEPLGVGDCSASSGGRTTVRSGEGCVSLVSSGTADGESVFLDASASGNDVFFFSPAKLSVLDRDSELDVYDARVGGTAAVLPPVTECAGDACQAPPTPPIDATPGSASFHGPGNVQSKRCPKGKRRITRKGKAHCVSKKRPKHRRSQKKAGQGDGGQK
jgi:hypothetical protein